MCVCVRERERGGERETCTTTFRKVLSPKRCVSSVYLYLCVLCVSALTSAKTQFPSFLFFCQYWERPDRPGNIILLNVHRSEEAY